MPASWALSWAFLGLLGPPGPFLGLPGPSGPSLARNLGPPGPSGPSWASWPLGLLALPGPPGPLWLGTLARAGYPSRYSLGGFSSLLVVGARSRRPQVAGSCVLLLTRRKCHLLAPLLPRRPLPGPGPFGPLSPGEKESTPQHAAGCPRRVYPGAGRVYPGRAEYTPCPARKRYMGTPPPTRPGRPDPAGQHPCGVHVRCTPGINRNQHGINQNVHLQNQPESTRNQPEC